MTTAPPPYLSFRGIGKVFPGVKALDGISFDCYAGQIHALMMHSKPALPSFIRNCILVPEMTVAENIYLG